MTSARKVLVAERLKCPSSSPIGVYGPTMKTSSRPITSGGSNRLHSTPASHNRWKGSFPWASIQASGVQIKPSTPRVTSPDSTEIRSGSSAPWAVSELAISLADRCVSRAIRGPSKASQITPAPATDTQADTERSRSGAAVIRPNPAGRRGPGGSSPWTAPPAAAAGLAAQLTRDRGGYRAGCPEHCRGEHLESALLVQG